MGYIVKLKKGNTTIYGRRVYKTKAGINKSINSPRGQATIKRNKYKNVTAVKQRIRRKLL